MVQYYFRLRFYFPAHHSINSDASTIEIPVAPEGNNLRLSPLDGEGTIKSARHMVLSGGPYSDFDYAQDAGTRARHALIQYAIHSRVGIDLGKDRATGGLSKYAKDKIERNTGIQIINDVHGLLVYAGVGNTKFMHVNPATLILGRGEFDFITQVQQTYAQHFRLTDKESVAFELFSASQFELSTRSRFITLVMAIEALLMPVVRKKVVHDHVAHLVDFTANSDLPESEKASLIGSLEWLYQESISKTGRRLASKLLGNEYYANMMPASFFTKCYTFRSQLVHSGTLSDGKINLDSWVGELERFVADLLKASIRPVDV
jgi:hypothetical protein